jgi:hypothetical protein
VFSPPIAPILMRGSAARIALANATKRSAYSLGDSVPAFEIGLFSLM